MNVLQWIIFVCELSGFAFKTVPRHLPGGNDEEESIGDNVALLGLQPAHPSIPLLRDIEVVAISRFNPQG